MSEKKRKSKSATEHRPEKKQRTSGSVSVKHITAPDVLKPVIASISSKSYPKDITLQPFSEKTNRSSRLLLHSADHPTIDYTATEGTDTNEQYLNHYIAVYDPNSKSLKVTEAKKLVVRGSLRPHQKAEVVEEETDVPPPTLQGTRAALTEAFGSKKSKKAAQAIAENRMLGQGEEGATIANAILSNIKEEDSDEEMIDPSSAIRASKPLPPPNLHTQEISEVYSLSSLIHPSPASNTLKALNPGPWLARVKAGKDVQSLRSRFVADRLSYIIPLYKASEDDPTLVQQFQLLRYIALLIEVSQYLNKQRRRLPVPSPDKWPEGTVSDGTPSTLLHPILNHFFPDRTLSDRGMTLLRTTIMALTLHIIPPNREITKSALVTDPALITLDLAMDAAEVRKLYHELGCRVKPATEKELDTWGFRKNKKKNKEDKAIKPNFAVLQFPLSFPKVSGGRRAPARR